MRFCSVGTQTHLISCIPPHHHQTPPPTPSPNSPQVDAFPLARRSCLRGVSAGVKFRTRKVVQNQMCHAVFLAVFNNVKDPRQKHIKKMAFPYSDIIKAALLSLCGLCLPEHHCCHWSSIHTHTHTHCDYHVNGAFCNRWMCQTRDGAFTFGRWMDCGGRKYGGGLSGLPKLVLFAFIK